MDLPKRVSWTLPSQHGFSLGPELRPVSFAVEWPGGRSSVRQYMSRHSPGILLEQ